MRAYRQALQALGWRDLGLVLARLTRALDDGIPADDGGRAAWARAACALASTAAHMQAEGGNAPVNAAFVADMVRAMVRAASALRAMAPDAGGSVGSAMLRAVACMLPAQSRADGRPPPFAGAAVLDGLLRSTNGQHDQEPTAKRRRAAADPAGQPDSAAGLRLLADTLGDADHGGAHRHCVRILRALDGALVARAAAHGDAAVSAELARLAQVLMDRGCALLEAGATAGEAFACDLFACIRDTVPVVPVAGAAVSECAARLVRMLAEEFRPRVTAAADAGALYMFCAEQRRRCYQWAALCRVGAWLVHHGAAEAVAAECGRLCWLQVQAVAPERCSPAVRNVWCLLLRESLAHIALDLPGGSGRPLCADSADAQARVFAAVARLLVRMAYILVDPPDPLHPLLLQSLRLCGRLLRSVAPHAATLRLCDALQPAAPGEDSFGQWGGTLVDYIFCPAAAVAAEPTDGESPDLDAECARADADEVARETLLAAVVAAFADLGRTVVEGPAQEVAAQGFRVLLQWLQAFAAAARDTAGVQARQFEAQQRVNIGLATDKARLVGMATDWTRLQRIPLVRVPEGPGVVGERATFRPAAAQALLLLAALPAIVLLGDGARAVLARCLAWDDDSGGGSAELAVRLATALAERGHKQAAFAAVRVLGSILGVQSHLVSGSADRLRLPSVQARSHSPASTEALMQLAMQLGVCRLLLDPALLAALVDRVRDGRVLRSPRALCAIQLWLDMIGCVVRHSLFRTYTAGGPRGAAEGAQQQPFTAWWAQALALGTRCLAGVLADGGSADPARVRAACIVPAHLLSWHQFLPIAEGSARAFAAAGGAAYAGTDPPGSGSAAAVLYYLATRLWTAVPALGRSRTGLAAMRACRDVWGIVSDALSLLRRLTQYPAARAVLAAPAHVAGLGALLPGILDGSGVPQLVRDLTRANAAPAVADYTYDVEDEPDLLPFPVVGIDGPSEPPSDKSSQETTGADAGDGATDSDVFDKLLHESARLRRMRPRPPRALDEYYGARMLGPLWAAHIDELLRLPAHIAFGPPPADPPGGPRVLERLADHTGVLYSVLTPLLAARDRLAAPAALWPALATAVPPAAIAAALAEVHPPDAATRLCVSAALVLSELAAGPSDAASAVAAAIVAHLVPAAASAAAAGGADRGRCTTALLFLAWRQRRQLVRHLAAAAACLQTVAGHMLAELAQDRPLLAACGLAGSSSSGLEDLPAGAHPDLIALTGQPAGQPVVSSMRLLVRHSAVFQAMFAGPFAESCAVQQGGRRFALQCDHAALASLVAVLHRCVFAAHHSQLVDRALTVDAAVRILELALYYDLRPAIAPLLAHLCTALAADEPPALEPATLDRLALMHTEPWDHHLPSTPPAALAAGRLLTAVILLHLDALDLRCVIGPDPAPFAAAATRLFQDPSPMWPVRLQANGPHTTLTGASIPGP
ncbi:hypothetical protein H4R19_001937 [Coemansia spiralis]|nr:hypothetical protein H4R19_001937 [Coemansia spiralis]